MVVDSSILAAANGLATHADPECALRAARLLRGLRSGTTRIVLDNRHEILTEYLGVARTGATGAGSQFVRWLFSRQYDPKRCQRVDIQRIPDAPFYDPYPMHADLAGFDLGDRKFISTSMASGRSAAIANATDSDWCAVKDALLSECAIEVVFVCPDTLDC